MTLFNGVFPDPNPQLVDLPQDGRTRATVHGSDYTASELPDAAGADIRRLKLLNEGLAVALEQEKKLGAAISRDCNATALERNALRAMNADLAAAVEALTTLVALLAKVRGE